LSNAFDLPPSWLAVIEIKCIWSIKVIFRPTL
jgi:hypothetical protein